MQAILAACVCICVPFTGFAQTAGTLDANFDGDGISVFNGSGQNSANSICIDPSSNKIVVAGYHSNNIQDRFNFIRLNPDGSPDLSFDGNGQLWIDVNPNGDDRCVSVKVLPDGTILGIGYENDIQNDPNTWNIVLVKLLVDGSLDPDFGNSGIVVTDFSGGFERAYDFDVTSTGKIIVVGQISEAGQSDFLIVQYNSNGSIDNTFSFDGKVSIDFSGSTDCATAVEIQNDGKIVIGGYTYVSSCNWFAVARLNPDGSLDNSFSTDGKYSNWVRMANDEHYIQDLEILDDGSIILGGNVNVVGGGTRDWALLKLLSDGSLDNSFGVTGRMVTDMGTSDDRLTGLTHEGYGKIIATGSKRIGTNSDLVLARYTEAGLLDQSFTSDGIVVTDGGAGIGIYGEGIVFHSVDQEIYVAVCGATNQINGTDYNMMVARYHTGLNVGLVENSLNPVFQGIQPNPVQSSATVMYSLRESDALTLSLFDQQGHLLATYLNAKELPAGEHTQTITMPEGLAAGNYLLVMSSPKGKMSIQVTKAP